MPAVPAVPKVRVGASSSSNGSCAASANRDFCLPLQAQAMIPMNAEKDSTVMISRSVLMSMSAPGQRVLTEVPSTWR